MLAQGLVVALALGVAQAPRRDWEAGARGLALALAPGAAPEQGFVLELVGYGRGGAPQSLGPPSVPSVVRGSGRVELRRAELVEWYVERPGAVEQGFTLLAPGMVPAGAAGAAGAPLTLELRAGDGWSARVEPGGRDARFTRAGSPGSPGVGYRGLVAWDAAGRALDAWLVAEGAHLSIHVEDAGARWPLFVDPLIAVEEAKLTASDAEQADKLGWSIAAEGELVLAGATGDDDHGEESGAAYAFAGGAGGWVEEAKLSAGAFGEGASFDLFGQALDYEHGLAAIAASNGPGRTADAGAVYLFERSAAGWSAREKLAASDGDDGDRFGQALDLDGDLLLVGAAEDSDLALRAGSAYLFERSAGAFHEIQKLAAADAAAEASFGAAVAASPPLLAIGAPGRAGGGAVYLFERGVAGWSQTAVLLPPDGDPDAAFGSAVAVDEGRVLVGAPRCGNCSTQGAAYLFGRAGSGWALLESFALEGGHGFDRFGNDVALRGELLAVAAKWADGEATGEGAVGLWQRCAGAWRPRGVLRASDAFAFDEFGTAVALARELVAIGSYRDDDDGSFSGSAYVFRLEEAAPFTTFCPGTFGGCPCANGSPGAGCANSTGEGARIEVLAGTSSVAADDLVLRASGLPPFAPARFFAGTRVPAAPFGDGRLCVVPLARFPLRAASAAGILDEGPGLAAATAHFPPGARPTPCTSLFVQVWYADPPGPCGSGFNVSNGLRITFAP